MKIFPLAVRTRRSILSGMIRTVLALLALGIAVRGEDLEIDLKAGEHKVVTLPSPVDDSHLRDPIGYTGPGTRARLFTRSIELKNTGEKALTGRLLNVNGRNMTSSETLRNAMGPSDGRVAMERLFSFWRDHRAHAGSGAALAAEPFAALNFWGYTLCGEDTLSLARLAKIYGIESRYVPLNGHIAGEYYFDHEWHVVDGDQNACYLRLDNKTWASAEDLRADPFLALRTKIFGKHGPMNRATSAFNTALLEYVTPTDPKSTRLKVGPAPLNTFTIQPGETLIWHCDTPPDPMVGTLNSEKPERLKEAALATIEHRLNVAKGQHSDKGVLTVRGPYPIAKVVNATTGQTMVTKDVVFKAEIPVKSDNDKVSVFMQCSQFALPLLTKGANSVALETSDGEAHVTYHYDAYPDALVPDLRVAATAKDGRFPGRASFNITTKPAADRLWWQVSMDRDFAFIPPNFDTIVPAVPVLGFDALTETFLSPGRAYYLRVKAHAGDVWGEWSVPVQFRVTKPAQPQNGHFADAGGGQVRLSWTGEAEEFLVFASNRADFLPEVYGAEEINAMEGPVVKQKSPNKNLVGTVKQAQFEFSPQYRYFRVIARQGGMLSVPGALWKLPDEFAAKLPPPTILQVRYAKKEKGEVYLAKEEKLVPPPPKLAEEMKAAAPDKTEPDAKGNQQQKEAFHGLAPR